MFVHDNDSSREPAETVKNSGRNSASNRYTPDEIAGLAQQLSKAGRSGEVAVQAFTAMDAVAVPALIEVLGSGTRLARENAARALGQIGPAAYDAIPALTIASREDHRWVRREAARALVKIENAAEPPKTGVALQREQEPIVAPAQQPEPHSLQLDTVGRRVVAREIPEGAMRTRRLMSYGFRLACIAFVIWEFYRIVSGKTPVLLGIALIIGMLMLLRTNLVVSKKYSSVDPGYALELPIQPTMTSGMTPEFIADILGEETVLNAIRLDLMKTQRIGYREIWRLGVITPDQDMFDPRPDQLTRWEGLAKGFRDSSYRANRLELIPLNRTAVLHSTNHLNAQLNNLLISGGAVEPLIPSYPSWSYSLSTKLSPGEFIRIRDIQISPSLASADRSRYLPGFLKEDGFPLKESYADGDPLTTERGGTIVVDNGRMVIIHPKYYVQRRLMDDQGNLVYIGLDEDFGHGAQSAVYMRPSVSRLLIRCISSRGYTPILRYRSFPYASDHMLPLLDTPMSCSGWADLFIDTRGQGRLFVAKERTEAEWREMMNRLRELFFAELAKKDYHLLGLTKDSAHLNHYLYRKQEILEDYFTIQDWQVL
jgi:hypothetical protein